MTEVAMMPANGDPVHRHGTSTMATDSDEIPTAPLSLESENIKGRLVRPGEAEDGATSTSEGIPVNGHLPSPLSTPTDTETETTPRNPSGMQREHQKSNGYVAEGLMSQEDRIEKGLHDALSPEPPKEQATKDFSVPKSRSRSGTKTSDHGHVRRLSASKIQELTAAPESLPIATVPDYPLSASLAEGSGRPSMATQLENARKPSADLIETLRSHGLPDTPSDRTTKLGRPAVSTRTVSTPPVSRRTSASQPPARSSSTRRNSFHPAPRPAPLNLESGSNFPSNTPKEPAPAPSARQESLEHRPPSPIPPAIPLPPLSVPTLLQLELAAQRPSPLYIHQSYANDIPYESSAVKFERLKNFLVLPSYLERTLTFGALACLDAWLWTFTILPLRFCVAFGVLVRWWAYIVGKETRWLVGFVWEGLGRMWQRGRRGRSMSRTAGHDSAPSTDTSRSRSRARDASNGSVPTANGVLSESVHRPENGRAVGNGHAHAAARGHSRSHPTPFRHRRTKSMPSNLTSFHKADLLQGAVIIFSCMALMNIDASRMYHFIRAQSAVKLYVIYNLVEVGDRLLSALGQDIFECLFSSETLSRNSSGRSKVILPLGMFLLSLIYNVAHVVVLFYQVITLNVAVNSYSNALLSLLMSNQFVEIKSSVFKRFEKENTFQLTCADIVERFQLWIILLIIGMRNVVEVGGLSVPGAGSEIGEDGMAATTVPLHSPSNLPASFTILPSWLWSGEVLSPFLVVIGSEMLVDWIKHAYINKFNNIKPNFYGRILDILCKDYYTNAFVTPSLTRRLGLPLLPLSCLFIRASFQTYHMFLATHLPAPLPPSTQTSLSVESATPSSPAMVAALDRLDNVIRTALGRAVYGYPYGAASDSVKKLWLSWTSDDAIALVTMVTVFFLAFLVLLIFKLLLGMVLLRYSRDRYARMKVKEHAIATGKTERDTFDAKGKRVGGHGEVEVGDEKRRWIYGEDTEGLRKARAKEKRDEAKRGEDKDFSTVSRYEMIAKRIW